MIEIRDTADDGEEVEIIRLARYYPHNYCRLDKKLREFAATHASANPIPPDPADDGPEADLCYFFRHRPNGYKIKCRHESSTSPLYIFMHNVTIVRHNKIIHGKEVRS